MTLHKGQSSKLISTSFYLEDASTLLWVWASVSQNYFFVVVVLLSIKLAEGQHSINLPILCKKNLLCKRIQVVLPSSFCFMQLSWNLMAWSGWPLPLFLYSLCPVFLKILLLLLFKLANLEMWDPANGKKTPQFPPPFRQLRVTSHLAVLPSQG